MITGERTEGIEVAVATSADALTDEEIQRLTLLQRRCSYQPILLELGMDIRRLEFARWLVQRGILSEGPEIARTDSATDKHCGLVARS